MWYFLHLIYDSNMGHFSCARVPENNIIFSLQLSEVPLNIYFVFYLPISLFADN